MADFILIALCLITGALFRRSGTLPADAYKGINAFIIYLALPAVSFKYLPQIQWRRELLLPALAPGMVWLVAWCYVAVYKHRNPGISSATSGALKLSAGLSNTSFIGFPLVMAYFSEQELGIAIICDQVTFLLLSTVGIITAIRSSRQQQLTVALVLKKVLGFPPLLGCVMALVLPRYIAIDPLMPLFNKLAATVGPLALFSIGLQLKFKGWRGEIRHIIMALSFKLMLAPAIITGIVLILGMKGMVPRISIFEAAMPTLLSSGILAGQYGLNPKLTNLIIGIGILLCFITTAFWYWATVLLV